MISLFFFFLNDTATTEIYTLSLHDALPILEDGESGRYVVQIGAESVWLERLGDLRDGGREAGQEEGQPLLGGVLELDRKSTRLNSSHPSISYAVFCLKKKNYI